MLVTIQLTEEERREALEMYVKDKLGLVGEVVEIYIYSGSIAIKPIEENTCYESF